MKSQKTLDTSKRLHQNNTRVFERMVFEGVQEWMVLEGVHERMVLEGVHERDGA